MDKLDWNDDDIPESWKRHYLDRMTDLIDKYKPDLLYTDGHLPFEDYGLKMVAHLTHKARSCTRRYPKPSTTARRQTDCAIGHVRAGS